MQSINQFGHFLKELRIRNKITMREFAKKVGQDIGYISRIERGLLKPPRKEKTLRQYASTLHVDWDSLDMKEMRLLASVSAGKIPDKILDNEELASKLPLFFGFLEKPQNTNKILHFLETLQNV